jgi:hypothetical protein
MVLFINNNNDIYKDNEQFNSLTHLEYYLNNYEYN